MTYEEFKQQLDQAFADGLTDRALAERLGVYKPTATRWRNGIKKPRAFMYPIILGQELPAKSPSPIVSQANFQLIKALRQARSNIRMDDFRALLRRTFDSTLAPTYTQMSEAMQIEKDTIGRWRKGRTLPFRYELQTICKYLANLLENNAR